MKEMWYSMSEYRIEKLSKKHQKRDFSCGKMALDEFLKTMAGQHARRNLSQTYVLTKSDAQVVIGYYTLTTTSVLPAFIPPHLAHKIPSAYPLPCALLARLAVDRHRHGRGIGGLFLVSAMRRVAAISESIGCYALLVDAKDENAKAFYEHFGFHTLLDDENHLFLTLGEISRWLSNTS
jgi:GNAT superfamily N-acetyltransferase